MTGVWLDEREFMPHAPANVGQQVNVNHDGCPAGLDRKRRLYVKRTRGSVVAYCHHCGRKGILRDAASGEQVWKSLEQTVDDEIMSVDEYKKYQAQQWIDTYLDGLSDKSGFPESALSWLRSKQLVPKTAGVVWGAPVGETPGLIIPMRGNPALIGVQVRRAFTKHEQADKGEQKYKTFTLSDYTDPHIYGLDWCQTVVLTEDYMSAVRISETGVARAVPLYCTSAPNKLIASLLRRGVEHVVVWLDNDNPGVVDAAFKIVRHSGVLFKSCTCVCHLPEPARLTDAKLTTYLKELEAARVG